MALSPQTIFDLLQLIKESLLVQRNNGRNIPRLWVERCGFHPPEMLSKQIISMPDLLPNNLQGDIHPLLDFSHWNNIESEVYELLRPSLPLATKFLTEAARSRFWIAMFFGERRCVSDEDYKDYRERVQEVPSWTKGHYDFVQANLVLLGRQEFISYYFSSERPLSTSDVSIGPEAYASTRHIHPHTLIFLANDFLVVIFQRMKTPYNDSREILRFNV